MTELAYLEKVDPSRRMMRFYAIWIAPTLFGRRRCINRAGRLADGFLGHPLPDVCVQAPGYVPGSGVASAVGSRERSALAA
jgi:hypothetical protein